MYEENSEEFQKEYDLMKKQARLDVLKELFTEKQILIPFTETERSGNSILTFTYLQRKKEEKIDRIIKKDFWTVDIEYDPFLKKVSNTICDCPNCTINRAESDEYECKHIKKSKEILEVIL